MAEKDEITRDKARAQKVLDFVHLLPVPSGVGVGSPFVMRPFQESFIRDIYEPHINGRRCVRRGILSIGRKNGKSAMIACLALVHLCGPEHEANGEIYSAATERDQAALVFKIAMQIVNAVPVLRQEIKIIPSTKTMIHYVSGSFYRAISAEAASKFGFNPTFVIYDELAQAKNRDLYDALDTSMGARQEPLFIAISTQSYDPNHILSLLIDDGLKGDDPTNVVHLHETPEDVDAFDPKNWYASNPALGDFRDFDDLRILAERAKRMPSFESSFRNLFLNQRVDSKSPLIPTAVWEACKDHDCRLELGEKLYLALDLSATTDLCALGAVSVEDGDRVAAWFWKPGDMLNQHQDRDRVPYPAWAKAGLIEAHPGRVIDYGHVAVKIAEICTDYQVLGMAYDRWRIENLLKEFAIAGFDAWVDGKDDPIEGGLRLVPWGQGFKDMGPAVDALESSVIERKLKHNGNPVLKWCITNAMAVTDPAGNRKLDKSKSRFRIDGALVITMALGIKYREIEKDDINYDWETRKVIAL